MRQCEIECETVRKKAVRCDGRVICHHCNQYGMFFFVCVCVCDLAVMERVCGYVLTRRDRFKREGEGRGGYREDA